MGYINEFSECEANYILTAFHRSENVAHFDNDELCSHSHQQAIFSKHKDDIIHCHDKGFRKPSWLVKKLQEDVADIVNDERFQKNIVNKFQNIVRSMSFNETILWCVSLLIDFHQKDECHEYLTLAIKLTLLAYWRVKYVYHTEITTVMKTMTEFMKYISMFNCVNSRKLFHVCIFFFNEEFYHQSEDHLYPVFLKVIEVAYVLRYNLFNVQRKDSRLVKMYYFQQAILYNPLRFLLVTAHGYQDPANPDPTTLLRFRKYIQLYDKKNILGYRGTRYQEETLRNAQHRPFQVLLLYVKALYYASGYSINFYGQVLNILWESIPDPYLSRKQFMSSFEKANEYPEFFCEAWDWYIAWTKMRHDKNENGPRSLKHLARCSVRHTLTESVRLPFGIEVLDIPQTLKEYLHLL